MTLTWWSTLRSRWPNTKVKRSHCSSNRRKLLHLLHHLRLSSQSKRRRKRRKMSQKKMSLHHGNHLTFSTCHRMRLRWLSMVCESTWKRSLIAHSHHDLNTNQMRKCSTHWSRSVSQWYNYMRWLHTLPLSDHSWLWSTVFFGDFQFNSTDLS